MQEGVRVLERNAFAEELTEDEGCCSAKPEAPRSMPTSGDYEFRLYPGECMTVRSGR